MYCRVDVEPEFLEGKLGGCIKGMLQLGEKSLVVLGASAKHQCLNEQNHARPYLEHVPDGST
jgi:hypothetical protein